MKKKWLFIILGIILFILVAGGIGVFCLFQFTDVFGKKVIPRKIDSIEIRYAPGYNIATVEALNKEETFIEMQTITLKGEELNQIKKQVSKIYENNQKEKEISDEIYAIDDYELIINKTITVSVGKESGYGLVTNKKKKTDVIVPNSCLNALQKIIDKNNEKVLKKLSTGNAIIKMEGASIPIKSKENLKNIQESLTYYPVHIKDDYKTYDNGYYIELRLDNNVVLYLYKDSQLGYLSMKEGETDQSTYVVLLSGLSELLTKIYETSTK